MITKTKTSQTFLYFQTLLRKNVLISLQCKIPEYEVCKVWKEKDSNKIYVDLPGSKIMEKEIIGNVCDVCHIV